ncbi:hypothetical protein SAMN06272765_3868 [Streptomyces sp. Ag109_G2-15]|nr:hypothetical protein SAMN06272765_3868 [Streptomyces sp. Ag109_G2-15]
MLLFRIGDTPGPKIDITGVGEEVELVGEVELVELVQQPSTPRRQPPAARPAYQILSTHSG